MRNNNNQNARRPRGRHNNGPQRHGNSGHQSNRRTGGGGGGNPRVQSFDSNGPDVRIRGTADQINEKYVTLARDAASAGDRVLAESYLQHAEHYQRFINEITEEQNRYREQKEQQQKEQEQKEQAEAAVATESAADAPQPSDEGLEDLDQGFLVGARKKVKEPVADGEIVPEEIAVIEPEKKKRAPVKRRVPRAKPEAKAEEVSEA